MKFILLLMPLLFISTVQSKSLPCEMETIGIHQIQGNGSISPMLNQEVVVQGVITGDFRGKQALNGFFIQQEETDNDPMTSEGLFIHFNDLSMNLNVGDSIILQGKVSEKFKVTQLTSIKGIKVCDRGLDLPNAYAIKLPLDDINLEQFEGMLVTLKEPAMITDLFQYVKYGEMTVSSRMLMQPTALYYPGKNVKEIYDTNKRDRLIIDDGRMSEYSKPFPVGGDGIKSISAVNHLTLGQQVKTTGVLHFAFGKYKLQPTHAIEISEPFNNQKPLHPGGTTTVANFNLQNFFTTIDHGIENCGPKQNFSCRGADTADEFQRQLNKLVSAINTANPSVIGLQELENNKQSIKTLVTALNQDSKFEKWAFIDTGILGEDAIKVGLLYQPNEVETIGQYALLGNHVDDAFDETKNRVILAQSFESKKGKQFNIVVAHFKSKGCRDVEGENKDKNDGQGCFNAARVKVAEQMINWMNNDPTGQGIKATVVVGDLNSYQKEDPITLFKNQGFSNLAERYLSAYNWSVSYRGLVGSLDYILTNDEASKLSTGITQWRINSIHIKDFSYNKEALNEYQKRPDNFFQINPFSSSDHDLVMAGFNF